MTNILGKLENGLSKCPESREMDFGPFWETYFRHLFDKFLDHHVSKKWTPEGSSEGVAQIKKGSYIDTLVMRFSLKSELLIGNFNQNFSFLVKPYFMISQYRISVLKKTQIFGPNFEPCSSCGDVDSFWRKKRFLENIGPPKRHV